MKKPLNNSSSFVRIQEVLYSLLVCSLRHCWFAWNFNALHGEGDSAWTNNVGPKCITPCVHEVVLLANKPYYTDEWLQLSIHAIFIEHPR